MTERQPAGVPGDVSLVDVLDRLADAGYDTDFFVQDDGHVCCGRCRTCQPPASLALDGVRRLEGASDPADMAAVLALRCESCGSRGTAVVRFGPEAGEGEAILLTGLDDQRPAGIDVAEDVATGGTG